jgi:hypothetical protein
MTILYFVCFLSVVQFVVSINSKKKSQEAKNLIATASLNPHSADWIEVISTLQNLAEDGDSESVVLLGRYYLSRGSRSLRISSIKYVFECLQLLDQECYYRMGVLLWKLLEEKDSQLLQLIQTRISDLDIISPLYYFQQAYFLSSKENSPSPVDKVDITKKAQEAHQFICNKLAYLPLYTELQLNRVWSYSSLSKYLDPKTSLKWNQIVNNLQDFDHLFQEYHGDTNQPQILNVLKDAVNLTLEIIDYHGEATLLQQEQHQHQQSNHPSSMIKINHTVTPLNPFQFHLLLDRIQDVVATLASQVAAYNTIAGRLSAIYAVYDDYCYQVSAQEEHEAACFNGAMSSAISFYRRGANQQEINTDDDVAELLEIARDHPTAATKWQRAWQTPRVYDATLPRQQPWWNANEFEVAQLLSETFQRHRSEIERGLDALIAQDQGQGHSSQQQSKGVQIRSTLSPDLAEMNSNSETTDTPTVTSFQRVFTPYIGVKDENIGNNSTALIADWAEFGPLFDGFQWQKHRCRYIQPLCDSLEQYSGEELCRNFHAQQEEIDRKELDRLCGTTDTVVTLLRLRPGAHILPHCGTTNRRLILHQLLRGGDDVHYRVGEEWLHHYRYISPEKYTSTIKQELFVNDHLVTDKILIASNAQNSCAQVEDNQQQLRTSATTALPGSVIVFDDSYEHEVLHQGIEDRFVLLVVLRHPDDQRRWKT